MVLQHTVRPTVHERYANSVLRICNIEMGYERTIASLIHSPVMLPTNLTAE